MGQKQNLQVILEFADKKSNPVYLEKAVLVLSAICNASMIFILPFFSFYLFIYLLLITLL